ncbi:MAG: pantoate--beta-alanine ligase [Elusimicrobiota bacterium]
MKFFKEPARVQKWAENIRKEEKTIGFVPTMGALHIGHESLIKKAVKKNDSVVVSLFVNPTQFGPDEDYSSYPRKFEKDKHMCEKCGVDVLFKPGLDDMYEKNHSTAVKVKDLTNTMCGKSRPGHFRGVTTVVAKLFNIVKPHRAYFGQKDYQQYRVIQRMTRDLNFDLELVMCPIVREKDGLAVSSRNKYLDKEQRAQAVFLYKALIKGRKLIEQGVDSVEKINRKIKSVIKENIKQGEIDYAGVYDSVSLKPAEKIDRDVVLACAVKIGKARLIDNILVKPDE